MNFKKYTILFVFIFIILQVNNSWSQTNTPPTITAIGDQIYCPLSQINIVTDFNIVDSDDTEIDALFIQISTGYTRDKDMLSLTGSHPNITTSWSALEGKLTLSGINSSPVTYLDLIAAVKDVVFESSSAVISGEKDFSITISEANYLPSTGHYYEYIPAIGITWGSAKTAAEGRNYYGLQGYLATVTSVEEAQLTGEQAAGAGWIGGNDTASEGVWKWVTGPENGTIFWNGLANGSSPNFAFWNTGEPNQSGGNEDYAHITAPGVGVPGSWNDLSNTGDPNSSSPYHPQGYIVEYGGMEGDPILNISGNTKVSVASINSITEGSTCGPDTVLLTATATLGEDILWFDSLTGGSLLFTGANYITSTITSSTTFYALASANGCLTGVRTPVVATVYDIPTITSVADVTICSAGSGTLVATASAGIINWYNTPTGGVSIGTGENFPSPSLTSTTTYYVDATENGCTTAVRTPITLNVQYTAIPTTTSIQQNFCDVENATIADLTITGENISWYAANTGGTALEIYELLVNNTTYYATQTINGCESDLRLAVDVSVFETVTPLQTIDIPTISECDNTVDGDDTNGFMEIDLTSNASILLNGKAATDFTLTYFTDIGFTSQISNPATFTNTSSGGQTIYVRMANNLDTTCFTDISFELEINELPVISNSITFKNCDEDGVPDGFTDYNLDGANNAITYGDANLTVTYHLTFNDADTNFSPIDPSPFNNSTANTVYARVENSFGCHRVSTVDLEVSTTSFPADFNYKLENCDADSINDGLYIFDLTDATQYFLTQLPPQNLSVHYYRNLTDAQLEQHEVLPQTGYMSETPFSQTLYVRVENADNGDCFGIGEHLTLIVHPRPEFEVNSTAIVCLNLPPTTLGIVNPNPIYTYEWTNENGLIISNNPTVDVSSKGIYTVIATSNLNCESFPQTVTVSESIIANITLDAVTIADDSENNTISINPDNLGIGDYEFALDDNFGPYQDEPFFENVTAGIHTIFIRDKNNCGIAQIDISVLGFPKFFTPNNDGFNDTWQIKGVNATFFSTSLIYIFDRFGKVVAKIDPTIEGWDGYLNGAMLSSTDYWFYMQLIDKNGNMREKKGHFSLIRR